MPKRHRKRGRLWLNDGSCVRLKPLYRNRVWSYDFVKERTHDGRPLRMLTVIDEHTRECLAIRVGRRLNSSDLLDCLADLMIEHGIPEHIRSADGAEFTAKAARAWLSRMGVRTLFIKPGSPWENGYNERFNGSLRDELLNGESFLTLPEAQVLTERWLREYSKVRADSR